MIGNAGGLCERNVERQEAHQQKPDVRGERIEYEEATEQLLTHKTSGVGPGVRQAGHWHAAQVVPCVPEREADAPQGHEP